jgi:hypothetical protein
MAPVASLLTAPFECLVYVKVEQARTLVVSAGLTALQHDAGAVS